MKKLISKYNTLLRYLKGDSVSLSFLCKYAFGQVLAYSGIGNYVAFRAGAYKLYLTKSPVAMVLYGAPDRIREEEAVAQTLLKEGDICLDLGANIGNFTLAASSLVGKTGHVFSFEAHPRTAEYMRRNIELNDLHNVTLVQSALGDVAGELYFSSEGYDDINHVVENGELKVNVIRLDEYLPLKDYQDIELIKLDVEGFELFVLKGGERTFRKARYVLFEAFDQNCALFGYGVNDLYTWFESHDFVLTDKDTGLRLEKTAGRKDVLTNVLAVRKDIFDTIAKVAI